VGGLALIVVVVGALLFFKTHAREPPKLNPYPMSGPYDSSTERLGNFDLKLPLQHGSASVTSIAEQANVSSSRPPTSSSSGRLSPLRFVGPTSLSATTASQIPNASSVYSNSASESEAFGSEPNLSPAAAQLPSHEGNNAPANLQPTDEQVDLVRTLRDANIPAADIARVLERIGTGVFDEDQRSRVIDGINPGPAPPSYDSLRR